MKKLYIFKVGKTFQNTKEKLGDFDDWVKHFTQNPNLHIKTIDVINDEKLPLFEDTLGVVITGSHSMVTDNLDWSINVEKWIQKARKKYSNLGYMLWPSTYCKSFRWFSSK